MSNILNWNYNPSCMKVDDFKIPLLDKDIFYLEKIINSSLDCNSTLFLDEIRKDSDFALTFQQYIEKFLESPPGFFILEGLQLISSTKWLSAFKILSYMIGQYYPQDKEGCIFREVKNRGTAVGEGQSSRYSDSREGGNFHTDGAQCGFPVPDYFSLMCMRKSLYGGKFIIINVDNLYHYFKQNYPQYLNTLMELFHFDCRGDQKDGESTTIQKPIFFFENNNVCITYLRKYIDSAHTHPGVVPLTSKQRQALDLLDTALENPYFAVETLLNEGEIIFINNKKIIHGRTSFQDEKGKERLLYRIWLKKHVLHNHT